MHVSVEQMLGNHSDLVFYEKRTREGLVYTYSRLLTHCWTITYSFFTEMFVIVVRWQSNKSSFACVIKNRWIPYNLTGDRSCLVSAEQMLGNDCAFRESLIWTQEWFIHTHSFVYCRGTKNSWVFKVVSSGAGNWAMSEDECADLLTYQRQRICLDEQLAAIQQDKGCWFCSSS